MIAKRTSILRPTFLAAAMSLSLSGVAGDITGAGATFPYAVYTKWAEAYKDATGNTVNYQGIGSSGGQKQIKAKTVDFAGSDAPMKIEELEEFHLVQFPAVIGGVTVVFNLPGIESGKVKLDAATLANIFRGAITKWNDSAIAALNPGMTLPSTAITVVHRADGSGTTFVFTNYLALNSVSFRTEVGADKEVNWPKGTLGGKGNAGVAANVLKIAGAVGYVDYADAKKNNMKFAALKNRAGDFVLPSQEAMASAAAKADFKVRGMAPAMLDQPGAATWPIVSATFILGYQQGDAAKQESVKEFFKWSFENGKTLAEELGFVALPPSVIKLVEAEMANLR